MFRCDPEPFLSACLGWLSTKGLVASAAHGDVLCLSAVSFLDSVLVAYEVVKPRDDRKTSQDLQYRMQSLKNRDVGKKLQSEQ